VLQSVAATVQFGEESRRTGSVTTFSDARIRVRDRFCECTGISGGINPHLTNRETLELGKILGTQLDTVSTRCLSNYLL
jgi:hypothetical protein